MSGRPSTKRCAVIACDRKHWAKGLCDKHYQRQPHVRLRRRRRHVSLEGSLVRSNWEQSAKRMAYMSKYRFSPSGRFRIHMSNVKRRGIGNEMTIELYTLLTSKPCHYCGGKSPGRDFVGLDRVDPSLGYLVENVVPCCFTCNVMKLDHSEPDFLKHIAKILAYSQDKISPVLKAQRE